VSSPSNLRDVGSGRRHRDPAGKAALFSHGAPPLVVDDADDVALTRTRVRAVEAEGRRKTGTLVVECSACGISSRVSYLDFLLLNLPVGVWLPLPGLGYNRRMTCPACGQWTWLRAHWLS
jgi:hypothetical protein